MLQASARPLFDHKPERLALTGYRCAMAGYDHGDASCWDELWSSYVTDGGLGFACNAMGSLQYFVRAIRSAVPEGNSYYPRNCQRVCRQECLVLSLLSAQQHRSHEEAAYALQQLLPGSAMQQADDVVAAATRFAHCLTEEQLMLLPVPIDVIQSIMESGSCPAYCPYKLN